MNRALPRWAGDNDKIGGIIITTTLKEIKLAMYGGGVNSTAMLILLTEQGHTMDYVLFADPGGERPDTYEYIKMFSDWLVAHNQPAVTVIKPLLPKQVFDKTLEGECLRLKTLPGLAFGRRSCSVKWKVKPVDRFIRNNISTNGQKITKYIAFDADETQRVCRARKLSAQGYDVVFPLHDAQEITRGKCIDIIAHAGLSVPPKSSCFLCPARTKDEILDVAIKYPDLIERAINLEINAFKRQQKIKGLGRRFSWEQYLKKEVNLKNNYPYPEILCECIDG